MYLVNDMVVYIAIMSRHWRKHFIFLTHTVAIATTSKILSPDMLWQWCKYSQYYVVALQPLDKCGWGGGGSWGKPPHTIHNDTYAHQYIHTHHRVGRLYK